MDNLELAQVEVTSRQSEIAQQVVMLSDLELAAIGGGIGDTIL